MKKGIAALAVLAAATFATIGLTVGSAGAHDATLSIDCFNVTANFTQFHTNPPNSGTNTAVVTVNGVAHNFSFTTATYTANVPFVSHSGDPDVVATVTFHGLDGVTGGSSAKFPADGCAAPTTTTVAPTTTTVKVPTNVSPAVVVRPAATVAAAVVVAPAFTG